MTNIVSSFRQIYSEKPDYNQNTAKEAQNLMREDR